jgi:hypothetical protein
MGTDAHRVLPGLVSLILYLCWMRLKWGQNSWFM